MVIIIIKILSTSKDWIKFALIKIWPKFGGFLSLIFAILILDLHLLLCVDWDFLGLRKIRLFVTACYRRLRQLCWHMKSQCLARWIVVCERCGFVRKGNGAIVIGNVASAQSKPKYSIRKLSTIYNRSLQTCRNNVIFYSFTFGLRERGYT